ncbi:conserved hypothetical protein [Nostocoides japonicum T1-X7]|uniref:Gamma carbonic anhydrase family protein n=1 Tax=Nostocoides japonicum T1-X7 TaxID=1194083 RepID=A0A077LWU5_9MICO|nr:gamma carbonic anhydrase family protein [Tetrasphaera japonica]CCH76410.1 conserved hypothetical protein [Tetrasphaera japonica T1-X7]
MRLRLADHAPDVPASAFVAPNAVLVGDVVLGEDASVWYSATLRGDLNRITVGEGSNVQDSATLHADPTFPCVVGRGVTIGHNAVVHGCTVEDDVLIGMGAVVLNGAHVGSGSLIAAGSVIGQGARIPPRSLVAGVPATVKRALGDSELERIRANGAAYVELGRRHRDAQVEE